MSDAVKAYFAGVVTYQRGSRSSSRYWVAFREKASTPMRHYYAKYCCSRKSLLAARWCGVGETEELALTDLLTKEAHA